MLVEVPEWCEWSRGESPLLFVAPHGGRRPPVDVTLLPRRLRVNDLFTPDVALTLAGRLAAGVVINRAQDRNTLDLNRVSEVRQRAPWFLHLLGQQIDWIIARHGHAEVVFVHGWNTGQPKCDIGIGALETAGVLQLPSGARLTVTESYVHTRIVALRAACADVEITATIGEKYPGGHRNNILQLFAAHGAAADDPLIQRIARWSQEGRVNALQLELGIPLRWPGAWRERFVAAVARAFAASRISDDRRVTPSSGCLGPRPDEAAPRARHAALQFYDAAADLGMFAGVGRAGPRSTAGRLLLFLGGQRVALFTGEDATLRGTCVTPLEFRADGASLHVRFAGPMLFLEDAAAYLDLEAALGASRLAEARLDLQFRHLQRRAPDSGAQFGTVTGDVRVGRRQLRVNASGFSNAGALRASGLARQTMIAAAFGAQRGVLSRAGDGSTSGLAVCFGPGSAETLSEPRISVHTGADAYTPAALELACAEHVPLQGRPLSRMAILRPGGAGRYLRVTFGVAEYRWGDLAGHGLYEHARPVESAGIERR